MCRWKKRCQRLQAGETGERASRRLRSAPLRLCNGKNPLGDAQENIKLRSPSTAERGPAGRVWGGNKSEGWGDGGAHPQTLSTAPDQPQRGEKSGSAHALTSPCAAGQPTPPSRRRRPPVRALHLP